MRGKRAARRCSRAIACALRLLGVRDLGAKEDYPTAQMPPPLTDLLGGGLAWRQHTGGHEDRSNMKHFLVWADRHIHHEPPMAAR